MLLGYNFTGKWSSPVVSGRRPPPCSDFTLTMVDDHRAVLFGGIGGRGELKHLYVLDIARMVSDQLYLHCVCSGGSLCGV